MNISINPFLYQLSNKGYMAWEYNPFRNFRITDKDSSGLEDVENGDIVDLDTSLLNFDMIT